MTRVALTALVSVALILLVRVFFRGSFADAIVSAYESLFNVSYEEARDFYIRRVRPNIGVIVAGAALVPFTVMLYMQISYFTRCFAEISKGLDSLVKDKGREIELSPEMLSMERKLNAIRLTLQNRSGT